MVVDAYEHRYLTLENIWYWCWRWTIQQVFMSMHLLCMYKFSTLIIWWHKNVEGERCNECSRQCWRLQWISSALGGHHTKVRNIVFWTKTKTKTKTTAQLLAATTLLVRCFCWMFLPSGMSWERGTWATSSRSAKQLPQRCSRGSTVRLLLGGFSLSEWRWTTLSSI